MILIDYSNRAINAILSFSSELKNDPDGIENLIRHVVLTTILSDKLKHKGYGELILCADARNYWRKDFFPYYKGSRKKARDKSGLPWEKIFEVLNNLLDDLNKVFSYRVIQVDGAEGDDVIAVLVKWASTNDLDNNPLLPQAKPTMIVSSDFDFKQLHRYGVRQWSPVLKALVKAEADYMTNGHRQHIAKAGDDGIPSVLNEDAVLVTEGKRQLPMKADRLAEFVAIGKEACRNDFERANWVRNETLIDFDFIPQGIYDKIVSEIEKPRSTLGKGAIMDYLIKHRCGELLDSIDDF